MKKRNLNSSSRIQFALNNHVQLRAQRDYPLDEEDIAKLNTVYNLALLYLDTTLHELKLFRDEIYQVTTQHAFKMPEELIQRHQYMFDMLKGHFKLGVEMSITHFTNIIDQILRKLQAMRDGLYAENKPLVLSHISKKMENKHQSRVGCLLKGYIRPGKDRIYLNLDNLWLSPESMCATLIHEASHRFAHTSDFDNVYYNYLHYDNMHGRIGHFLSWCDGSYEKVNQLTMQQRTNHATSVEQFVSDVARHALRNQRDEEKKRVYPDRELIKTDIGRLFTAKKPISKLAVLQTAANVVLAAEIGYLAYKLL